MENKEEVSVIMPVYNGKAYLRDAVASVIAQSYKSWTLYIIDDGSTDGSAQMLDQIVKEDPRIVVKHIKNSGVSKARNVGLDAAKGKYVVFVDADDMLTPDSLEARVMATAVADMVIARFATFITPGKVIEKSPLRKKMQWNKEEALDNLVAGGELGYQGYLFNKIFLRDKIEKYQIRFQEGIAYNEDRLFCVTYASCCETVNLSDSLVYWYRENPSGAMGRLKRMQDAEFDRIMSEFIAYDMLLQTVADYPGCFFRTAADAQSRASYLKKNLQQGQPRLRHAFNHAIWKYGLTAFRAPASVFPPIKKLKILGHMLLLQ